MTTWLTYQGASKAHAYSNTEDKGKIVRFACGFFTSKETMETKHLEHCQQCEKKLDKR